MRELVRLACRIKLVKPINNAGPELTKALQRLVKKIVAGKATHEMSDEKIEAALFPYQINKICKQLATFGDVLAMQLIEHKMDSGEE